MFNSLISLENSKYNTIAQQTIEDLNLGPIFTRLIEISEGEEAIIYRMCQDKGTIDYRQAIMGDFLANPELLDELLKELKAFGRFRFKFVNEVEKSNNLFYLIELLLVVEASVDCLEGLYQTLCYYPIKAKGLVDLKTSVETMMESDTYKQMKEDRKAIRYIFKQIKSVEVSVNMNTGMRPYEAEITEVNEHRYRYPEAFRRVSDALERTDEFLGKQTRHYAPVFPVEKVDLNLLEEIEYALKDNKDTIKNFLTNYNKIDAAPFIKLHEEATFYQAGVSLFSIMNSAGIPSTFPDMRDSYGFTMSVEDGYNIYLAQIMAREGMASELVLNDIHMAVGEIALLTGANRGGKTTYTQTAGQIQILGQLGFPVPARKAKLDICDSVMTHFPLIEQAVVDFGRFGRACYDFKETFGHLTGKSLLLMNESFAGTSHLESIEIASEVIHALADKTVSVIYNTHLHELYDETKHHPGVKSLTAGDTGTDTEFKIMDGLPKGYSQALDIAARYGVTYDKLTSQLGGEDRA